MGWRFVLQPNGLLARFSEVVDDFTHYDMTAAEAVRLAREGNGYGGMDYADAVAKVQRGLDDEPVWGCAPRADKLSRWHEALETIGQRHGKSVAQSRKKDLSRKQEEPTP